MLKTLKVSTLFENFFPKIFYRVKTKNYQTFFSFFKVKLKDFLVLLESLFSKKKMFYLMIILLLQRSFVTLIKIKAGTKILKGHIDVHRYFVIKPCTLICDLCESFYIKILRSKVFSTYHFNCILIFISST